MLRRTFDFDLLMGTDLLSTFGVIIDFASKCIIIKHSKVPIRTDLPPNPVIVRVPVNLLSSSTIRNLSVVTEVKCRWICQE